ncbi:MAG: thiamine pyrophosphate-dependent enzyme [Cytophagales bacterium]|nr:thiamine pyrophosphate-dependent enzyme [Cytophagales bacterium]
MNKSHIPKQLKLSQKEILCDYRLACESRAASLLARKEVFMGKAKFGIFGDGKEVAQLAMAKVFQKGDFRSGYYRDQTFMMAIGELTIQQYFAQLYAHADVKVEPSSAGRMMNSHFGTRMLDDNGQWKKLVHLKNSTSDISANASQMPRLLGLAYASKLYKENKLLQDLTDFSNQGNEVAFGTIGNAATSEGMFFETINAAGVLQVPMLVAVWDDDYGISVPKEYHTTKQDISKALAGFQRTADEPGYEIFTVKGWDYPALCETYQQAEKICREEHIPVLIHVKEMTQPQGHSTSGSHERYKSKERLAWEAAYDCNKKMREWLLENNIATAVQLDTIEQEARVEVKRQKNAAWKAFMDDVKKDQQEAMQLLKELATKSQASNHIEAIIKELKEIHHPTKLHAMRATKQALRHLRNEYLPAKKALIAWMKKTLKENEERFSTHLYSESKEAALKVPVVDPIIKQDAQWVDGREVLQRCFDAMLQRDPRVFAIGEDIGKIGDVNQAFAGLQQKHGILRVTDTGVRECTIVGQGIGAAMRGLRPIVEIQYLDYLPYALQIMGDDLATLRYRTKGGQKAPLIIRTRGHRLEGIWHAGSYLAGIIHNVRGIYVLVPRNMTQAAGLYNTMLQSDDPALIIECLNGYRLKEQIPENIASFTVPLGTPVILKEGTDVTIVTYGAMCRIVMEATTALEEVGISCEVIDVQTLLPFDVHHKIVASLKKTNRVVFADEDVPGGTTAYMMQKVLEEQKAYYYLDSMPVTITSQAHRPAYADDGNYISKPNVEDVFDKIYTLMSEYAPKKYLPIDTHEDCQRITL